MNGKEGGKLLAARIGIILVGILLIIGIVLISKAFFRGMLTGMALMGCVAVIIWMRRAMRGKR